MGTPGKNTDPGKREAVPREYDSQKSGRERAGKNLALQTRRHACWKGKKKKGGDEEPYAPKKDVFDSPFQSGDYTGQDVAKGGERFTSAELEETPSREPIIGAKRRGVRILLRTEKGRRRGRKAVLYRGGEEPWETILQKKAPRGKSR